MVKPYLYVPGECLDEATIAGLVRLATSLGVTVPSQPTESMRGLLVRSVQLAEMKIARGPVERRWDDLRTKPASAART